VNRRPSPDRQPRSTVGAKVARPGAQYYLIVVSATSHNTDLDLGALIVNLYAKTGNSDSSYGTYSIQDAGCGTLPPPHLTDGATAAGDPAFFAVADGVTVTGTVCFQVDSADAKSLRLFTEPPFTYPDGLDDPPTPDAHAHWFALSSPESLAVAENRCY
jgi:hypothetical protein